MENELRIDLECCHYRFNKVPKYLLYHNYSRVKFINGYFTKRNLVVHTIMYSHDYMYFGMTVNDTFYYNVMYIQKLVHHSVLSIDVAIIGRNFLNPS